MTRLSAAGTRSPMRARDLSGEDRSTYRRWVRRSVILYVTIIAALAVGLSLHDRPDAQLASRDLTTGSAAATKAAPQAAGTNARHH